MEAPRILSEEQRSVLATTFHFIESATIYFLSILPVVDEVDERLLKGLLEMSEMCLRRLPFYFPELQPLAEEWKRGSSNG